MRILVDENIPLAEAAFGAFGTVVPCPGGGLTPDVVRGADVLLVRSVTRVDEALLAGSRVRFVGSATIGTDHVDAAYLAARGIPFAHAPGSNAESVMEYVLAALLELAVRQQRSLRGLRVGIVGCGHIGGGLAERLPALGCEVLLNDPPLAEAAERRGAAHPFLPLDEVLAAADVVTVHVPLNREGPYATHPLFDVPQIERLRPGAWLLNTCRGPVVSNAALKARGDRLGGLVLDVWEGEPGIDVDLLRRVDLGTSHIAGYSYDGKVGGTVLLYEALARHFEVGTPWRYEAALAAGPADRPALTAPEPDLPEAAWLQALVRQMYPIAEDDARLRMLPERPAHERGAYFTSLRKTYPRRRAFSRHTLPDAGVPPAYRTAVRQGLRVRPAS